jgi:hypothetical protein
MSLTRLNTSSKEYTTAKTWPANDGRGYLFITVISGSVTVAFGGGDGEIPIAAGAFYEPSVTPTSAFTITPTAAVYVVHSDQQVA